MAFKANDLVVAAVLLIVGIYLVGAVYGTVPSSEFHKVTNESITVDVGNTTVVNQSYGTYYYGNATVYNATNAKLVAGTDYAWYPGNSSVHWYSTNNTTNGNIAHITYSFDAKPAMARNSIGTIGSGFTLGAVAVIVGAAVWILSLLGAFSGGNGGGGGGRL